MSEPSQPARNLDVASLVGDITESFRRTAEEVVPWFTSTMPPMYFQDTETETQAAHLRAIIAARASGGPIEVTLRSDDGLDWTSIRSSTDASILSELIHELPEDAALQSAKVHTASDGSLLLVRFQLGESDRFDPADPEQAKKLDELLAYAEEHDPEFTPEVARDFLTRCCADLVTTMTPLRLHWLWSDFREISGTSGAKIALEHEERGDLSRIVITAGNTQNRVMMQRVADRLALEGIRVQRAYLDIIDDGEFGTVNHMSFIVEAPEGGRIDENGETWRWVRKDLKRLKWVDKATLALAYRKDWLTITRAEIVTALGSLAHQILVKVDPEAFNRDRILRTAESHFEHTQGIVQLFLNRFNPDLGPEEREIGDREKTIRERIDTAVDHENARRILHTYVDAATSVLRTNVFLEDRYALAMRISPELLRTEERDEVPYGVFFVHGRGFNGFHVRFRDIARGGVRAVRTIGPDQHSRELERLYDEVYGLAFAQQLKNKDIPEGGSKAVVLLESRAPVQRSVQAFVDALLDLITPEPETRARIIDYFGADELLYLGPDENITPDLIEWIVRRAAVRGYGMPTALMSSKPGAGINHKEFGVTSEGVTVFLDAGLRYIGIDPDRERFRVKITGGPDGDVAGNEIKILNRDYGQNALVVGIADGSGSGEDPDGLDHGELLRLVEHSLPIAAFDRSKLGPRGRVVTLDEPDGVMLRNTMHNRVEADAFVPAGGRPSTIHRDNWEDYLLPDGRPSARLIVEGANIYLTKDARRELAERGVTIIKDSTANKCGVICSSFEISACMILSEDEFLRIKPIFVEQVLEKLRGLARREAQLLLRLDEQHPDTPLFVMSERLSKALIRIADAIEAAICDLPDAKLGLFRGLVVSHLPPILVDTARERLWQLMPERYQRWIMAKSLATRLVYREGFEPFENMPNEAIARVAVRYLELERERVELMKAVSDSGIEEKGRLLELLESAGILSTLGGR